MSGDEGVADGGEGRAQKRNGKKRGRPDSSRSELGARKDYPLDARDNQELFSYYEEQKIVPNKAELEKVFDAMREPLPTAFRIMASAKEALSVKAQLQNQFQPLFAKKAETTEGGHLLRVLEWYPGGLAWSVATPRKVLRKDESLSTFHKFLIAQNAVGVVNRQEAVSMIPPLLLDMKPGLRAIDLCAAPGSKTAQLLDMLQAGLKGMSDGLVVANDVDIKRCWMLTHQLKRFARPDLVITSHEAQHFPGHPGLRFDRVLCDVPCSGDGTLRKAPDLWSKWTPHTGMGLHRLQVAIATRGFQLLVPGGRMVYSTCSMNPVENEAVVNVILDRFEDEIEVIDVSNELPGLIRRPGLIHWRVRDFGDSKPSEKIDEKLKYFDSYDTVPPRRRKVVPGQFPPQQPTDERKAALKRCLRVLPHDQDTGAFFVAVLRKKAPSTGKTENELHRGTSDDLDSEKTRQATKDDMNGNREQVTEGGTMEQKDNLKSDVKHRKSHLPGDNSDIEKNVPTATEGAQTEENAPKQPNGNKKRRGDPITQQMEEPLQLLSVQNPDALKNIVDFFSLDAGAAAKYFMTRSAQGEIPRKVYFLSPASRQTVDYNKIRLTNRGGLRVVFAGVRVLELTTREGLVTHRLGSEGLALIVPLMTGASPRILRLGKTDFCKMALSDTAIPHEDLSEESARAGVIAMPIGACVVQMLIGGAVVETVGAWRGRISLGISQAKEDLKELRQRLR